MLDDPRRRTPRTDRVLADPALREAVDRLGPRLVKHAVGEAQAACRRGEVEPEEVPELAARLLPRHATSMHGVVNATGVVVHTNLGRAPLSRAAVEAMDLAAGPTDVELDLDTGRRGRRGAGALATLAAAVPAAGGVHVVNNGAAALALATCALATGRTVVVARGEMVEIGDGFRIPELLESVGARLREVGTTNRVRLEDYANAVDDSTAFVLKVHPSNFRVEGFTSSVALTELATLPVPVVHDIGSGLLTPHPRLPGEPDATTSLRAGADLVTASGDKLLGGPQCGLMLGTASLVDRLRRHPFARALRVDKLTLAALEATLTGPTPPVPRALDARVEDLRARARTIVDALAGDRRGGGGRHLRARSAAAAPPGWSCPAPRWPSPPTWRARCGGGTPRWWATSSAAGCCSTSSRCRSRRTIWWPPRCARRPEGGTEPVHVIATAGHVDHGKSTLVRALTGTDPDRLEEEHRRGLSIQLGYAWASLPEVGEVAFVDVPGHERFVTTTLSGMGPVPAVLFVVAADDPWMPQSAEHLAALDALGVRHGILAVTRSDLADPAPAMTRARQEIAATSLGEVPAVAVSAVTGAGMQELRGGLVRLVQGLEDPPADAPVRLWVDRAFGIRGAGTVVTGTLPEGTVRTGDTLALGDQRVRVRGVESLERPAEAVRGTARVALNLGGRTPEDLGRGSVLVTPDAWHHTDLVDVALRSPEPLPERPTLHVGATSMTVHARPLGDALARLVLPTALPLRIGDRALLRDPGNRRVWGLRVVDPVPPPLRRRGAAAARARALAGADGSLADELDRRGVARRSLLRRIGVPVDAVPPGALATGDWLVAPRLAAELGARLQRSVGATMSSVDPGLPVAAAARELGVAEEVVLALVAPPLRTQGARLLAGSASSVPAPLAEAWAQVRADLESDPFRAPDANRLAELRLDKRALAALERAGALLRVDAAVVLLPGADDEAARRLAALPQPFTTSQARQALGTSRRVALPLLGHLDRRGLTRRLPDDTRTVT